MNTVTPLLQRYLLDHLLMNRVTCIPALDLLALLPDASVDAVICDPPYGISAEVPFIKDPNTGGAYKRVNEEWDMFVPIDWMEIAHQKVKSTGSVIVFGSWTTIDLIQAEARRLKWKPLNRIVWFKPDAPPNFSGRKLTESTETALWYSPHGSNWTYNRYVAKSMNMGMNLRDVWTFGQARGDRFHPTQKPLDLMERCVQLFTNPGDLVVDPFAGSGTTLVAAKIHGRRYLGSDITPEYVEAANKRLSLPYMKPMFGGEAA